MGEPRYTIRHYIHARTAIECVTTAPDGHTLFQTFTGTLSAGYDAAEDAIALHKRNIGTAEALGAGCRAGAGCGVGAMTTIKLSVSPQPYHDKLQGNDRQGWANLYRSLRHVELDEAGIADVIYKGHVIGPVLDGWRSYNHFISGQFIGIDMDTEDSPKRDVDAD